MSENKFTTERHGEYQTGRTYANGRPAPTPEYRAYCGAKARCTSQTDDDYPKYGGRGIEFRFASFEQFLAEIGRKPSPRHSLDRKENDGHYEPGNVRWATWHEQQRNRRSNKPLTINGKTKLLIEWANNDRKILHRISKRLAWGWCVECAVIQPINSHCVHMR